MPSCPPIPASKHACASPGRLAKRAVSSLPSDCVQLASAGPGRDGSAPQARTEAPGGNGTGAEGGGSTRGALETSLTRVALPLGTAAWRQSFELLLCLVLNFARGAALNVIIEAIHQVAARGPSVQELLDASMAGRNRHSAAPNETRRGAAPHSLDPRIGDSRSDGALGGHHGHAAVHAHAIWHTGGKRSEA